MRSLLTRAKAILQPPTARPFRWAAQARKLDEVIVGRVGIGRKPRGDMTSANDHTSEIEQLWHSSDPSKWQCALDHYWELINPTRLGLEREMDTLRPDHVRYLDADQWYDWLLKKYFLWKYTRSDRRTIFTGYLKQQANDAGRDHLLTIRNRVLGCENASIGDALRAAKEFKGLGSAGASGLLALLFPAKFGTIDRFAVGALRKVHCLPERDKLLRMKPENLTILDGVVLVEIMRRKAISLNELFHTSGWTPRKVDKVLWASDRRPPHHPSETCRVC